MALYEDDEIVREVTTEFEAGRTLTIKLKEDEQGMVFARNFLKQINLSNSVEARLDNLHKQIENGADVEKTKKQIDQYQADRLNMMVDFLFEIGCGWDNYKNKEAEERGEALPYTKEHIRRIKPSRTDKIVTNILRTLGFYKDAKEEKKPSANSPEQSLPEEKEAGNSQVGMVS